MAEVKTKDRVLSAALAAFGRRGYEATSLDALAGELGVRKQTILYYFPSKEALLEAVVDQAAGEMALALTDSLARPGRAWNRVEAIVRAVFRLAGRRPELLGLLREVTRLGPPAATRFALALGPLIDRATGFLDESMDQGELRRQDARLLLLVAYSSVVGAATEVEVLRALGVEPTARSLVRQRAALLGFLRSALLPA
ncbi:MAG: TetR/AcrR family transcriptional regulator [Acidimicrobiales bacterium]|nr:TetR/AcrR family transcriptional regulator [Acidimicrobiales bacterium]